MKSLVPVGRDSIISRLTPLPACSLIYAPPSTGKRTVADYLSTQSGVLGIDRRLIPFTYWKDDFLVEPELSMEMIRELIVWCRTAPRSLAGKVAIVRLDHERLDGTLWQASSRCTAALLKTLEEPPPYVRFILLASQPVASVIESRSMIVRAGLLSTDNVAEILFRVSDLDQASAKEVAALGSGRVAPALAAQAAVGAREGVLGVLSDLIALDHDAVAARAREWTSAQTALLIRAAHERVSGRFVVFRSEELSLLSSSAAMALLNVLRRTQGARPRLVLGAVVSALS